MRSFEDKTETLVRLLGSPSSNVSARQGDRVFNFHYEPQKWAEVRGILPKIKSRLEKLGFTPHLHSFADIIKAILERDAKQPINAMIKAEGKFNLPDQNYTHDLQHFLTRTDPNHPLTLESPIVASLTAILDEAAQTPKSVLLLIDVEMLHPLIRVSAFEQILQGRFKVPTVFFYPGLSGNVGDNPSFLGIYTSDGNYRSTHIY
jgi:hypothetical protein